MKKILLFFLLLLFIAFIARSQESTIIGGSTGGSSSTSNGTTYSNPVADVNVIPPSPAVASMNKFVDMPVSLYTGTADISIPIYTIRLNQITIPISLDYHASGLKVEEIASFVGAGWNLSAGGAISRTVMGSPDDLWTVNKGFFYNASRIVSSNGQLDYGSFLNGCTEVSAVRSRPRNALDSVAEGFLDTQPDLYHYSFPGGGGKFGFMPQRQVVYLSTDNIKIIKHPFENFSTRQSEGWDVNRYYEWILQDASGVRYTFSNAEKTASKSICGSDLSGARKQSFQSAWHLSEIAVNGEWIRFYYAGETQQYTVRFSESNKVPVDAGTASGSSSITSCREETTLYAKRLVRIETSKGCTVYFDAYTPRNDLAGSNRLDEIRIEQNGQPVYRYKLNYGYFGDNTKLKLLSIQPVSTTDQEPQNGFRLAYYDDDIFPAINSKSLDFWGYYNGADNTYLFTEYRDDNWLLGPTTAVANREPNLAKAVAGSLRRITYPTSGYTELTYELHEYFATSYRTVNTKTALAGSGSASLPAIGMTPAFTVKQDCSADLRLTMNNKSYLQRTDGTVFSGFTGAPVTFNLYKKNYSGTWEALTLHSTTGNRKKLSAGEYYLKVTNPNSYSVQLTLSYDQKVSTNVNVGGIRIKKMAFYNAEGSKQFVKGYHYTVGASNQSSGVLFTPLYYNHFSYTINGTVTSGGGCVDSGGNTFINFDESSVVPMGTYMGGHLGYSEVKEFYIDPADDTPGDIPLNVLKNGYTAHLFINDYIPVTGGYPYYQQEDLGYKNGKKRFEQIYERVGDIFSLVKQTEYRYGQRSIQSNFGGMILKRAIDDQCYHCNYTLAPLNLTMYPRRYINYPTTWHYLVKTIETQYEHATTSFFTAVTSSAYDTLPPYAHYLPLETTVEQRKGDVITQRYNRLTDTPALISEYIFSRNGVRTEASKIDYKGLLPVNVYQWDRQESSWFHKLEVQVDDSGNIIRQTDYPGTSASLTKNYRWGYNNAFPVLEAINVLPEQVIYTSFEESNKDGAWINPLRIINTGKAKTGKCFYRIPSTEKITLNIPAGISRISYWCKGTLNTTVNAGTITELASLEPDANGWIFYEKEIVTTAATTLSLTTPAGITLDIDELRICPSGSVVNTYTYNPLIGMTSSTDANNIITHYEYDGLGRLQCVKDDAGNILKTHTYHYKQ